MTKQKMTRPEQSRRKLQGKHRQMAATVLIYALLAVAVAWILRSASSNRSVALAKSPESQPLFIHTIENQAGPPRPAPQGMVWILGGEFSMGANDPPDMDEVGMKATEDARP